MSFKGGMVNYYHEARAQVKKLKTMQEDNKRRAERRAEIIAPAAQDPMQLLSVVGTSCKLFRGADAHAANEAGDNLVPWNGDNTNMIDRFDVRSLLDFYKEPDPRVLAARQKSHEEHKLEETLRFEAYRDLVRLMARGLGEAQGLALVDRDSLERRAAQHLAMQAANDAVYNPNPRGPGGQQGSGAGPGFTGPGGVPAGTGVYSAMGFSYDSAQPAGGGVGAAAVPISSSSSDDDSSDDDSSDDEGGGGALGTASEAELAQEAEDDRVDEMAEGFGLQDFMYRLHKAQEREGEEEARLRNAPKRRTNRKRARMRAKRMAGQGLNAATGLPLMQHDPYKDPSALINPWEDARTQRRPDSPDRLPGRRHSPLYEAGGWRSRDASPVPGERQYITEFVGGPSAAPDTALGGHQHQGPSSIIDALPDRPDPAMWGGMQPVAREALAVQGIKHEDVHKRLKHDPGDASPPRRARSRSRSASRERWRRRSPSPPRHRRHSRSGSRERDRDRGRRYRGSRHSRSRSRDRSRDGERRQRGSDRGGGSYRRRSSSRSRSRGRSRSRSSSRDRHRRRDSDHSHRRSSEGGASSRGAAGRLSGAAAAAGAVAAAATSGKAAAAARASDASGVKETPQERLKRLMAAQLNKAAQKDSLASAQRKIQLEKDKVARQQIERVAMAAGRQRRSPSPARGDSPDDYRSRRH